MRRREKTSHLPPDILVVHVPNKQRLCCEGIRLHVDIGSGHFVDEAGFARVGEAGEDECSCAGIDGGKPGKMLSDLLEVSQ